jgi:hypothetical protein
MNTASGNGGGVHNNGSNAIMVNVTFMGDSASSGGGVYNDTSDPSITNGLFVGETTTSGGAIFNLNSNPTLTNLSLSGNVATTGGGLYNDTSNPVVNNSILWGNSDDGGSGAAAQIYNINSSTPLISYSIVQGSGGGGSNLDDDPDFLRDPDDGGDGWGVGGNDDYGDLHLKTDSPAINAGDNSLVPVGVTVDLDNNARIVGTIVDMGAYEYYDALPVAVDDDYNGDEDTTLNVPAPGVLDDDYQPNGDSFSITGNTEPANGSVTLNPNGSFEYTPVGDFFGDDIFTYTICEDDQQTDCDTATVTISVAPGTENDSPVAEDDNYDAVEDTELNVPASGVLDNDYDPDGDNISITENTQPTNGAVTLNADGSLTYMPNQDFFGVDTFNYTICDDGIPSMCDSALVTITVAPGTVNEAPVAGDDSYDTFEDNPLNVPAPGVLDNDDDPDGDNIAVTSNTQPTNGAVILNSDGSFIYTPDSGYFGEDSFEYTMCDDGAPSLCDSATVTINVARVSFKIYLPLIYRN